MPDVNINLIDDRHGLFGRGVLLPILDGGVFEEIEDHAAPVLAEVE